MQQNTFNTVICGFTVLSLSVITSTSRAEVSPEGAFAAGVLAYEEESYPTAIELFGQVLDADPDHLRAAHYLGLCFLALERYDEALDVLEPAAQQHQDDMDLQVDLGATYMLIGNMAFAARTLGRVIETNPRNARARYILGAALAQQGDCELASRHLAEARRLNAEFEGSSRYLAGICHAREGDINLAREELEPLARSPLDQPIADTARRFVQMALRTEGIETARVSGVASIAVQYDSNPSLASSTSESYDSVAPVFQLDMTLRAVANEGHTLAGRIGFYRSFYFPDEHAADYNYTHLSASGFYQLRARTGDVRHQLQLGYDFAVGFYDGEPPLTDANHVYSELHGARTVWNIRTTESLMTRVTLVVQYNKFATLRRNNVGFTSGLGQAIALPWLGMQLYLEGTMRVEQAQTLEYDVVAPGALFSLSARLPWRLILSGWIQFEHESHPASSEGRVDERINASITLQRQIIDHLGLALAYMHTENISTVERFDYGRDVLSLSIWGSL